MSAKRDLDEDFHYSSDDEEDDEDEFIPGIGSDDDNDSVNYEEESIPGNTPPFLQGKIYRDGLTIAYKRDGEFCIESRDSVPSAWSVQSPLLETPIKFGGWIGDPTAWLEFSVQIMKKKSTVDAFESKLLEAQRYHRSIEGTHASEKLSSSANEFDVHMKPSPTSGDSKLPGASSQHTECKKPGLKEPPSYSSKDPEGTTLKRNKIVENSSQEKRVVYSITGSQIVSSDGNQIIKFHGVFQQPDERIQTVFLISSVQVDEKTIQASASAAIHTPSVPVAKKPQRHAEDDSFQSEAEVEFQELIDLHDDASLSTEELRRRYYGGYNDDKFSKPAISSKRAKRFKDDDVYDF